MIRNAMPRRYLQCKSPVGRDGFVSAGGERAYRLLCLEGHVFLFTDKRLYAFKDLAIRFLRGDAIVDPDAWAVELEAVDMSSGPEGSLLVVKTDCVLEYRIDELVANAGASTTGPRNGWQADLGAKMIPTSAIDESLKQSVDLELTEVT
jgi:hypothetical protein